MWKTIKRNIKNIKSTVLGLAFLGAAIYMIIQKVDVNEWILGGMLVSGVFLTLSPDKYINLLEQTILGRVLLKKKEEGENDNGQQV